MLAGFGLVGLDDGAGAFHQRIGGGAGDQRLADNGVGACQQQRVDRQQHASGLLGAGLAQRFADLVDKSLGLLGRGA